MKCIVYFEFCPADVDKVIAKTAKAGEAREKDPDRFGTRLLPPQYTGQCKGFMLVDATTEQMTNAQVFWFPLMKLKYVPCDDVSNWVQTYQKSK